MQAPGACMFALKQDIRLHMQRPDIHALLAVLPFLTFTYATYPQVLLGIVIDAVWPPQSSPAACAKGALVSCAYMLTHTARLCSAAMCMCGVTLS